MEVLQARHYCLCGGLQREFDLLSNSLAGRMNDFVSSSFRDWWLCLLQVGALACRDLQLEGIQDTQVTQDPQDHKPNRATPALKPS